MLFTVIVDFQFRLQQSGTTAHLGCQVLGTFFIIAQLVIPGYFQIPISSWCNNISPIFAWINTTLEPRHDVYYLWWVHFLYTWCVVPRLLSILCSTAMFTFKLIIEIDIKCPASFTGRLLELYTCIYSIVYGNYLFTYGFITLEN